jgi:catechol 2,3-dioxygenase-like lactoylglutathione lyase family enzyme
MVSKSAMSVHVYGINHVAIEVDDVEKAVAFYEDVFGLEKLDEGEGDAFFKIGEHQFLAIFEVDEVRLGKRFRCDFRDPWGNHIQVVDLHDESLVWLLPYQEVQKAGITFGK